MAANLGTSTSLSTLNHHQSDVHLNAHQVLTAGQPQELLFPLHSQTPLDVTAPNDPSPQEPRDQPSTPSSPLLWEQRGPKVQLQGQHKPGEVLSSSLVSQQSQDTCTWQPQSAAIPARPPRCLSVDATLLVDGRKECNLVQLREQIRLGHPVAQVPLFRISHPDDEPNAPVASDTEIDPGLSATADRQVLEEAPDNLGSLWSFIQSILSHHHKSLGNLADRILKTGPEATIQLTQGFYIYAPQFGGTGYYVSRAQGVSKGHTLAVDPVVVKPSTSTGQVRYFITASANELTGFSPPPTPISTLAPTPTPTPRSWSPTSMPTITPVLAGSERPKLTHGDPVQGVMQRLKANLTVLRHHKSRSNVVDKASGSNFSEAKTANIDEEVLVEIVKRVLLEIARTE